MKFDGFGYGFGYGYGFRFRFRLCLSILLTILNVACTRVSSSHPTEAQSDSKAASLPGAGVKIGLVLDKGGKDDKSFNSAAFRGANEAVKELGIDLKMVESPDDAAFEPALRTFAERGYNLVLAIGFAQVDALKKVSAEFPATHFAIVDGKVEAANVASLMFAEHEGSYLVGYLAALLSKSSKVGFVGGMDIALIRRFQMGYEAGVKAANPKAEIVINYVGVNSSAWANPVRGKELALSQIAKGVDVIFHAAGASGIGVFDAAAEKQIYVIGCDSNQNSLKPGRVATSMLKRVDTAVLDIIREQVGGKYLSGTRYFGLKDNGIDYAIDSNNEQIIAPFKSRLDVIREKIIKGEIQVPDYYLVSKGS